MAHTITFDVYPCFMEAIADNIKKLRKIKDMSQKEVAIGVGIPQGQYSRIESGKVVPTIPTLQRIAAVFQVSVADLVKESNEVDEVNLPLLEKIKLIEQLEEDERNALLKIIDVALSKKKLKDNLTGLIAQEQ